MDELWMIGGKKRRKKSCQGSIQRTRWRVNLNVVGVW